MSLYWWFFLGQAIYLNLPGNHYREINTQRPGLGERIFDVSSGREHALLLISKGRVFSAASSSDSFPSRGQLGIPGHLEAFFQSSSHMGKIWNMQLVAY